MKKTFVMLAALAASLSGSALASDPQPVYTLEDVNINVGREYDISDLGLNTTDGYTLLLTGTWSNRRNTTLLWLSNEAGMGGNHGNSSDNQFHSTAIVGWTQTGRQATLFGDGSAISHTSPSGVTLPSNVGGAQTLFLTCQNGTATLYELASDGKLYQTSTWDGYATGDVVSLSFGAWKTDTSGGTNQVGTLDVALYSGVLSMDQMTRLVPEPTTATLSLLALAGLAARRRRK